MAHEIASTSVETVFTLEAWKTNTLSVLNNRVLSGGVLAETYATGAGVQQANLIWHGEVSVPPAGVVLDLMNLGDGFFANDAGTGPEQIGFAELREVIIQHYSGDRGVIVGPNPGDDLPWVPPGLAGSTLLAIGGSLRLSAPGDSGSTFPVSAGRNLVALSKTAASAIDPVIRVYLLGVSL